MLLQKQNLTALSASLVLLLTSQLSFAEQKVCVSNDTLPRHCNAGDIVVVRPAKIALVCDFNQQIIKLKPSAKTTEYLCVYTGNILKVKHNPNPPPPQRKAYPQKKKKKKSKMPFFN